MTDERDEPECFKLWRALPMYARTERLQRLRDDGGGIAADCLERLGAAKLCASTKVLEAVGEVLDHGLRIIERSPQVCCRVDCEQRGREDATCDHGRGPTGWVGMGSSLWPDIEKAARLLKENPLRDEAEVRAEAAQAAAEAELERARRAVERARARREKMKSK